jgi:protein arginine kinase
MKDFGNLFEHPHVWTAGSQAPPMVVSSRVRLARNLAGLPFPGHAGEAACEKIWERVEPVLNALPSLADPLSSGNARLSALERQLLVERHLISREHAARARGSGVVLRQDESVVILVNEEDHFRIQALGSGLCLDAMWKIVSRVDDEIAGRLEYAFSPRLGYLTACPTNVGTGMRASVMLHLPGLVLMDEMRPVINGVQKLGLTVRGLWGEGTEAAGNMFQISNQMTLGESETDIAEGLKQIVMEIVGHESDARSRLAESKRALLYDYTGRALGVLSHAHILTSSEALGHLSALRLGLDMDILGGVTRPEVDELLLLTQPAHLQSLEGHPLEAEERDIARAALVRSRLNPPPRRRPRRRKTGEG